MLVAPKQASERAGEQLKLAELKGERRMEKAPAAFLTHLRVSPSLPNIQQSVSQKSLTQP
jgi:hypothetical protein